MPISRPAEIFFQESHTLIHFMATPFALAKKMDQTLAEILSGIGDFEDSVINYKSELNVYSDTAIDLLHVHLVNLYLNYLVDIISSAREIDLDSQNHEQIISDVYSHTRMGFVDLSKFLRKEFAFEICDESEDKSELRKAIEFRNIYVHNHGLVRNEYLYRIPDSKFKQNQKIASKNSGWTHLLAKLVVELDQKFTSAFPNLDRSRVHNSDKCNLLGAI